MWLIGMMGSGKTQAGRLLAAEVRARFYDTDAMVAEMAEMPVAAIWEEIGEDGFRELERRAVATVPDTGAVAAAGGGAVLSAENREHMERGGPVVWLRCDPEVLARRLDGDRTRPLLSSEASVAGRLTSILDERATTYLDTATDVVDTDDMTLDEVVMRLIEIWER